MSALSGEMAVWRIWHPTYGVIYDEGGHQTRHLYIKRTEPAPEARMECPKPAQRALCVRPQWRQISMVQVHAGGSHSSVAEGNCVTARWGGKQPEAKPRSAG